jgi:hypothetical protein
MKSIKDAIEVRQMASKVPQEPKTYLTNEEIIECFAGRGQTELPTKKEMHQAKEDKIKTNRRRLIMPKRPRRPSSTYLSNLNPRIEQAERLWHKCWAHERGQLLRQVGLTNLEEIEQLANEKHVPDLILEHFNLVVEREGQ